MMNTPERLEVLMSVMYQTDFSIAIKSKVESDLLIINQCNNNSYQEEVVNGHLWRMISTTDRGLSKSRNLALKNARGTICLLADDDEVFEPSIWKDIIDSFDALTDATAIVFNVNRINVKMKKSYYSITQIREAPVIRSYGSVQLAFRLQVIRENSIWFDEKFGSGTEWGGGEDSLFQKKMRSLDLKIYEWPSTVATIDYGQGSRWFSGYDQKYFYNLGAFYSYAKQGRFTISVLLRALYTCFYKLRAERALSPLGKLVWMFRGFKGIQNDVTYQKYLELKKQD